MVPLMALGSMAAFGAIFGRALCGWVCPFGLIQDLLYEIPTRKWVLRPWLNSIKYVLLVGSVFLAPRFLGLESSAFYCNLCPMGTLEAVLPRAILAGDAAALAASWLRISVLATILLAAVFARRSFCKVFCPIGAILAIFNRVSAFSLRYTQADCPSCEACLTDCPMNVKIEDFRRREPVDETITAPSECILCLNCTKNCPHSNLSFTFWNLGKKPKKTDESAR
jgi:polyferredoxin